MNESAGQAPKPEVSLGTYLDGIKNLPTTPFVLIKLIDLFRQPDADVDDIVQLLRRDPALSLEVLRRCNNALNGREATIVDVNEAVYQLGFYEVYQTAVLLLGVRMMNVKNAIPGFPAEELRRHSSISAIAAGALAREMGVAEGIAFTAGLLHDIGKLALALAEQDRYVQLLNDCKQSGTSLGQAEEQTFGFNHSQVGAQLLRRWEVPEEVVLPVLGHTQAAPGEMMPILTQSASELAGHITGERRLPFSATPEGQRLMSLLWLETHRVDRWEREVRRKVEHVSAIKLA